MDWFKMKARYYDDLAIIAAGERAEILFTRACSWTAGADTNGFIPAAQLVAFRLTGVRQRAEALVRAGLWLPVAGGFQIRSWVVHQSEAYAAERKRLRDRNRARVQRANPQVEDDSRTTVARQSRDNRSNIAGLEREEELTPIPPPAEGACDGQHENCRGCGTTRRQRQKAARNAKPPWCGECDQATRIRGLDGDTPQRCPKCHPLLRSAESSGNLQREVG